LWKVFPPAGTMSGANKPRSRTLVFSTLCCVPCALLLCTGAPVALFKACMQPFDQSRLVILSLFGSHLIALLTLMFAVAGYTHWARRGSEPTIGIYKMTAPARAVETRNRKEAATHQVTETHASPSALPVRSQSLSTSRLRMQVTRMVDGGAPITDEAGLQSLLRSEREQRYQREHLARPPDLRSPTLGSSPLLAMSPPQPGANTQASPHLGSNSDKLVPMSSPAVPSCGTPSFPVSTAMVMGSRAAASHIGAGLTNSSPFMSSPYGVLPTSNMQPFDGSPFSGQAKRRLSSTGGGGSGNKFQRALYVPSSSDTQEDPSVIARRASDLLQLLCMVDPHTKTYHMPIWRDHLRKWIAAVILRPLAELFEGNDKLVQEASSRGVVAGANGMGGAFGAPTSSIFGGGGTNLFGPKPATSTVVPAPTPGQAMPVSKWLQHPHADEKSQALVLQYNKLKRFSELAGFSPESAAYARKRIFELAAGHCVAGYKWDSGGHGWNSAMPMDSELLIHVFATFWDTILPPIVASATPAPAPSAPALGAPSGSMFGGLGGGGGLLGGAPGGLFPNTSVAGKPAAGRTSVFWRTPAETVSFSSRHVSKAAEKTRIKSDVVILHQHHIPNIRVRPSGMGSALLDVASPSDSNAHGSEGIPKRAPPRYSLLVDGSEWVLAQGEHNAWEVLVIFVLQRAKCGGSLGGLDLRQEVFTSLQSAITFDGCAQVQRKDSVILSHGLLSILQPWSQLLEDLSLDKVKEEISSK